MVGYGVLILMALSIAHGSAALAEQARSINQTVPEISALEPELESLCRDLHEHPELEITSKSLNSGPRFSRRSAWAPSHWCRPSSGSGIGRPVGLSPRSLIFVALLS